MWDCAFRSGWWSGADTQDLPQITILVAILSRGKLNPIYRWATALFFLLWLGGQASAEVIDVKYPPIAWARRRLIKLDKPITPQVQR